jgi:ketosteroid isomerase-like protein
MAATDLDEATAQSFRALDEILRGNPDGYKQLFSRRDDITLGNPFGGFGRGWDAVVEQLERAASYYRDGEATGVETIIEVVEGTLAYTVVIERGRAKVGGGAEVNELAVRVTCVYRLEDDGWKLVHRHADPRVSRQPAESVVMS